MKDEIQGKAYINARNKGNRRAPQTKVWHGTMAA
jgi:hypothetical protein